MARLEYISRFWKDEVGQFEAAYNYLYYRGNRGRIEYRFELRPVESMRTDQNVSDIIALIYGNAWRWLKHNGNRDLKLLPHLWSAD